VIHPRAGINAMEAEACGAEGLVSFKTLGPFVVE